MSAANASNAKYLASFENLAPNRDKRQKIRALVQAYRSGKLKKFPEVERVVSLFTYKGKVFTSRAEKGYIQLMKQAGELKKETLDEEEYKLDQKVAKATRKVNKKNNSRTLDVILYTTPDKKGNASREDRTRKIGEEMMEDLYGHDHFDEHDQQHYKKYLKKRWRGLAQFWTGKLSVRGGSDKMLDDIKFHLIRKQEKYWRRLYRLCCTDPNFKDREARAPGYLEAIYVLNHETPDDEVKVQDPLETAKRMGGTKNTIDFKYTSNTLDLTKNTFREAMEKGNHVENECWINALYDFYGDNLLSPNKKRNLITREIILETLGKTEETIQNGLTIHEVVPFFEKYKLKLRVYDRFYNKIYAYDPYVPNFNNKPMHVMIDQDHVYTLNFELTTLEHKNMSNGDERETINIYTNNMYKVLERTPSTHYMISHVDDILEVMRGLDPNSPEDEAIHLIHRDDHLEELLWQLHEAKHVPQIRFQCGKISGITMRLNKRTVKIKSQQLVASDIDGCVYVEDVKCYNRCDEAFVDFSNRIFRLDHRSYYNKQDMDILFEYHTIANVGFLNKRQTTHGLIEIDMSKAYTSAFMAIDRVPVFNEFDIFKPYPEGQKIEDLNLYIVSGTESNKLFFNKTRNLCYGAFLKHFPDVKIHAVKKPSFTKKVNYERAVRELFESHVSNDEDENKLLKKQIAVCNFGLLETHVYKGNKSFLFNSYAEARFLSLIHI